MSTYFIILMAVFAFPWVLSFDPWVRFYRRWKYSLPAILLSALPFLIWDVYFAASGHWGFTDTHLWGKGWLGLPVEEWLFFFVVPYAGLFTHDVINHYFPLRKASNALAKQITAGMVILSSLVLIFGGGGVYTYFSLGSSLLVAVVAYYTLPPVSLLEAYRAYGVLLLPFLLVNGVLTGMWLEEPVVWYHAETITGTRIITIPAEDTFFGFSLLIINFILYRAFQKLNSARIPKG